MIFNEVKLIYKKSQLADAVVTESVKNHESIKHVNLIDLLQLVRMRNTNLHSFNIESNHSITALDQVIELMTSLSKDKDDENVVFILLENQNQDSSTFAKNLSAENSIELVDETILSNSKEIFNSLIMINRRNKIRHDYKQLHTREFAKAAKFVTASHQIAIFSTYKKAISRLQVIQ